MKKVSHSTKDTAKIARVFLEKILKNNKKNSGATIICLSGDLGAGKTTLTQSVARLLRIKNKIVSPTFVIYKKYPIKLKGYKYLFHLDAYRLRDGKELLNLGWKEIVNNKEHLIFVEWPENVKKVIPKNANYIYISHGEGNERILEV